VDSILYRSILVAASYETGEECEFYKIHDWNSRYDWSMTRVTIFVGIGLKCSCVFSRLIKAQLLCCVFRGKIKNPKILGVN